MTYKKHYSEWTDEQKIRHRLSVKNWRKTERGMLIYTYHKQKDICRRRGKEQPNYTLKAFIDWAYKNGFKKIYDSWKKNDFDTYSRPSFDRKDAYIGYTLSNIQIITWLENQKKGIGERANKKSVSILKVDVNGNIEKTYRSKNEAIADNLTCYASINKALKSGKLLKGYFYKLNNIL